MTSDLAGATDKLASKYYIWFCCSGYVGRDGPYPWPSARAALWRAAVAVVIVVRVNAAARDQFERRA